MLGGLRAVGSRSRAAAPRSSGPRFCIVPAGSDSVTHGGSGGRWGPCYVPSKHMPQRRQDRGHWDLTANPWKVCQPLPPTPPRTVCPPHHDNRVGRLRSGPKQLRILQLGGGRPPKVTKSRKRIANTSTRKILKPSGRKCCGVGGMEKICNNCGDKTPQIFARSLHEPAGELCWLTSLHIGEKRQRGWNPKPQTPAPPLHLFLETRLHECFALKASWKKL